MNENNGVVVQHKFRSLAGPRQRPSECHVHLRSLVGGCHTHLRHLFSIASARWESLELHFSAVFAAPYAHKQGKGIHGIIQENRRKTTGFGHVSLSFVLEKVKIAVSKGPRGQIPGGADYLLLASWAGVTFSAAQERQQGRFSRLFLFTIYRGVVPGAFHDHFYLHQSTLISLLS